MKRISFQIMQIKCNSKRITFPKEVNRTRIFSYEKWKQSEFLVILKRIKLSELTRFFETSLNFGQYKIKSGHKNIKTTYYTKNENFWQKLLIVFDATAYHTYLDSELKKKVEIWPNDIKGDKARTGYNILTAGDSQKNSRSQRCIWIEDKYKTIDWKRFGIWRQQTCIQYSWNSHQG